MSRISDPGRKLYFETFDAGPGGWWGWISNQAGPKPLEYRPGEVTSRSPWWIDYNHAPPGAGYLHMLMCLNTSGPQSEVINECGGPNRFIVGGFPTDFTGAQVTVRLRGELRAAGARLVVLIQGQVDGLVSGWLLTGQPIEVESAGSETVLSLTAETADWTALGARHDRTDMYGVRPLAQVLASVNVNVMFVLFPLEIAPMGPLAGDPHRLRPERDYPVWRHRLPEGYIVFDEVRIAFP
jgi:hypothetical protein